MLIYQLITFFKNTVFTLAQCIIMVNTRKTSNPHYSLIDWFSLFLSFFKFKKKQTNKQTLIYTPFHFPFPAAPPVSKVDEKLKAAEARRAELARVKAEELQKK